MVTLYLPEGIPIYAENVMENGITFVPQFEGLSQKLGS